ncbi:MAG: hypothetical protein ACHQ9S_21810 [Candidatus Binatia bacterium]
MGYARRYPGIVIASSAVLSLTTEDLPDALYRLQAERVVLVLSRPQKSCHLNWEATGVSIQRVLAGRGETVLPR